ncbi:phage tail tip lysozyme [Paraburkholderia phytofirmans]|uniref:Phage tail tip lysozyme n=1 Tax=Paraburkholderia phytofirmans TaxID=261302 RepID=A0ABW9BTR1_9BURK
MANKIAISITAKDAASGPIGKVRSSIEGLGRQIRSSKIDRLSNSISSGLSSNQGAISAITKFVERAGVIGGLTAFTVKIAQMESQWASSVRAINNLGIRTGLPTSTAYGVQYAGRLAGLPEEQVNGGIEQVRQAYSDALNNRNPEALKRFQAAGISTNPAQMESIESVLTKLATYTEALRKQGKYGGAQNFLGAAGAGQLIDFLNRGPGQVAADLAAAKAYLPTDDDIRRAREYADASAKLGITYDKLRTTILSDLEPPLSALLSSIQRSLDESVRGPRESDPKGRLWTGMERFGNLLRGNGPVSMTELQGTSSVGSGAQLEKARYMVEWYMNHGTSRNDAIAMVANASRESSLDDRAQNDSGHVGYFQWGKPRQDMYERTFGRPLTLARPEEQMGYSLLELNTTEAETARAMQRAKTLDEKTTAFSSLYERPNDAAREAAIRVGIARDLDSQLGQPQGEPGKVRVEIVHKNAPQGTSTNVSSTPNVETQLTTDRQQAPLGDQYAYSPGNF